MNNVSKTLKHHPLTQTLGHVHPKFTGNKHTNPLSHFDTKSLSK